MCEEPKKAFPLIIGSNNHKNKKWNFINHEAIDLSIL
jgi:hypothetical protein